MAFLFHWKIEKIIIYPYGGISKFSHWINVPNKEEILVNIMGPIFQIIFFFFFSKCLSYKYFELFKFYHYFLLIFNLLPIYPLDGGKLMIILFSYFVSFRYSYLVSFFISFVGIGILFALSIIEHSLIFFAILIFLFMKISEENKNLSFLFEHFLLERYLYFFPFPRTISVRDTKEFKKDCYHFVNGKEEKKVLKSIFNSSNL